MYGTVNYANAVFTKLSFSNQNLFEILRFFSATLRKIKLALSLKVKMFDNSHYKNEVREVKLFRTFSENKKMYIMTDCHDFRQSAVRAMTTHYSWIEVHCIDVQTGNELKGIEDIDDKDFAIIYIKPKTKEQYLHIYTKAGGQKSSPSSLAQIISLPWDGSQHPYINSAYYSAKLAIKACLCEHKARTIKLKYYVKEGFKLPLVSTFENPSSEIVVDFTGYCAFYDSNHYIDANISNNGERGSLIFSFDYKNEFFREYISTKKFQAIKHEL